MKFRNKRQWLEGQKIIDTSINIVDAASRSFSTEIQELIAKLLNEANHQIQKAHASVRGQQLLAGKDVLPIAELEE